MNKQVFVGFSYNKVSFDRVTWPLPSPLGGLQARVVQSLRDALSMCSLLILFRMALPPPICLSTFL